MVPKAEADAQIETLQRELAELRGVIEALQLDFKKEE
jgi:hypothetical protein